jgi:hypothetical protein
VLLVFVTLVGVGLGYWTHRARQQRRIVERIEQGGGMVCYERDGPTAPEPRNFVVEWLATVLSRDYLEGVTTAAVHDHELVRDLAALQGLETLIVVDEQLRDEDLLELARCKELQLLQIGDGRFSQSRWQLEDRSLQLIARLPNLQSAHLCGTNFTGKGIDALASSPKLKYLNIGSCAGSVRASDFEKIKRLGRIQSLLAWRHNLAGKNDYDKIVEW